MGGGVTQWVLIATHSGKSQRLGLVTPAVSVNAGRLTMHGVGEALVTLATTACNLSLSTLPMNAGCSAAGRHYNPFGQTHGGPDDDIRWVCLQLLVTIPCSMHW